MSAKFDILSPEMVEIIARNLDLANRIQFGQVSHDAHARLKELHELGMLITREDIEFMQSKSSHITLEYIRNRHNAAYAAGTLVEEFETTKMWFQQFCMVKSVAQTILTYLTSEYVIHDFHRYARTPEATANGEPSSCAHSSFVRNLVVAMRYHLHDVQFQKSGIKLLQTILSRIPMQPCHVLYECMQRIIQVHSTSPDPEGRTLISNLLEYMSTVEKNKTEKVTIPPIAARVNFIAVVLECVETFRFKGISAPESYHHGIMSEGLKVVVYMTTYADYRKKLTNRMFRLVFRSLVERNIHPLAKKAQWPSMPDFVPECFLLMLKNVQSRYNQSRITNDLLPMHLFLKNNLLYNLTRRPGAYNRAQSQETLIAELRLYSPLLKCGFKPRIKFEHIVQKTFNLLQPIVTTMHNEYSYMYRSDIVRLSRYALTDKVRTVTVQNSSDSQAFTIEYVTAVHKDLQTLFGQKMFIAMALNEIALHMKSVSKSSEREPPQDSSIQSLVVEWVFFLGALLYKHKDNQNMFISGMGMENLFVIGLQSSDFMQVEIMNVLCTTLRDNEAAVHQYYPDFLKQRFIVDDDNTTTFIKTMDRIAKTEYPPPIDTTVLLQVYGAYKQQTTHMQF